MIFTTAEEVLRLSATKGKNDLTKGSKFKSKTSNSPCPRSSSAFWIPNVFLSTFFSPFFPTVFFVNGPISYIYQTTLTRIRTLTQEKTNHIVQKDADTADGW